MRANRAQSAAPVSYTHLNYGSRLKVQDGQHVEAGAELIEGSINPHDLLRILDVYKRQVKDLDEDGIIRIGAEVRAGDILVGKVTPKGETDLTAEEMCIRDRPSAAPGGSIMPSFNIRSG